MKGREIAYRGLLRFYEGGYTNLTLNALLSEYEPSAEDRRLATRLFYGVIERKRTLDYQIESLSRRKVQKLDPPVLAALELGLYQLAFAAHIPPSAAVNESVKLVKKSRFQSASGFVNGILRSFLRNGGKLVFPKDPKERLEVEYSVSAWVLNSLIRDYGPDKAVLILQSALAPSKVFLRVNTLKITPEDAAKRLEDHGFSPVPHPLLPNCLILEDSGGFSDLAEFREGLFYVQDAASQFCVEGLDPKEGETVFDLCAAPGSKSFTAAMKMKDVGNILSFDLYPKRVELIQKGAERLSLHSITAKAGDACVFQKELGTANRVLCDVPCMGLGVIGRKPEIKYRDGCEEAALLSTQRDILENGAKYLSSKGILVYSTCSLNKRENEEQVSWFLDRHPEFSLDPLPFSKEGEGMKTFFPDEGENDGFFVARLRKQ